MHKLSNDRYIYTVSFRNTIWDFDNNCYGFEEALDEALENSEDII